MRKKVSMGKYRGLPIVDSALAMRPIAEWIRHHSTLQPRYLMEVGANYGQDADFLMQYFQASPENVYAFEPVPALYQKAKEIQPFQIFPFAVSHNNGETEFYCIDPVIHAKNTGVSSLFKEWNQDKNIRWGEKSKDIKTIKVKTIRLDSFMEEHKIQEIDFLKIDAEGADYAVLEGAGQRIKDIHSIHVEGSTRPVYEGHPCFPEIKKLLKYHNFELISLLRWRDMVDSFWIQPRFLIP